MNKVMFLNDLLNINADDIRNDFGLKTSGIVKLKNILSNPDLNIPKYVKVLDLFSTFDLESSELKEAYFKLTKDITAPKIILARSSDRDEKPGVFESHPSLYLPNNPETSFNNWLTAARKVRESGARAVIAQQMIGDLEEFEYGQTWDYDSHHLSIKINSFGGSNISFFVNSTDFILGDTPMITACYGLASKIARGDKDASIISKNSDNVLVSNLNQDYTGKSLIRYAQKHIDLILLDTPTAIASMRYDTELQHNRGTYDQYEKISHPLPDWLYFESDDESKFASTFVPSIEYDLFNNPELQEMRFSPDVLFSLASKLKNRLNSDVEFEGAISKDGLFLFQLREYELPKKNFNKLSVVDDSKIFLKPKSNRSNSLGFNKFSGDIYVDDELIDVPKGGIFLYSGDDIFHGSNIVKFKKYDKLIFRSYISSNHVYAASHSYGRTVQALFELQKLGVEAIALGEDNVAKFYRRDVPEDRINMINGNLIYRNMTAECAGRCAQIYFNN